MPCYDKCQTKIQNEKQKEHTHKLKNQVNVIVIFSLQHVQQSNYILMMQILQKHNLTISSLCICCILEGIKNLLQCNSLTCLFICSLPYNTIGLHVQHTFVNMTHLLPKREANNNTYTLSKLWSNLILSQHVFVNFF